MTPAETPQNMEPNSKGKHCVSRVKADPRKQSAKALPPCRVCDGPGAGLHYGVNTCDPCKAFFRRTLTGTKAQKCCGGENEIGKCRISKTSKNPCSFCRLKKCKEVGMSKSAIRLGRYTLAKKTKDTIELKGGEREIKPANVVQLEGFINSVMAAHKTTLEYMYDQPGYENLEEIKKQATEQVLRSDQSSPLDSQTFLKLYSLGIEPDCRVKNLKYWLEYISLACNQFVKFLQQVPGFRDLPHEDKIGLAKGSFLEVDIMNHAYLVCDDVSVVVIPHNGRYMPIFVDNILGKDLTRYPMKLVSKMKNMKFTQEELCLVKILSIFAPERWNFKEPESIDAIRQVCLDSLYYVMNGYTDRERNKRFSEIVDILQHAAETAHLVENFCQTTLIHFAKLDVLASTPAITKEMLLGGMP